VTSARARLTVIAVPAALYFFSYFHRVAPAVVAADLMRAFGITAASLALLAAVYPYVFAAMALIGGSLADGIGPRWTLTAGGVAMAFGTALFGLAPTFGVAVAGRLLMGVGASVVLIAWLSLIVAWLEPEEFATAAGWTQTVGNIGGLAASTPLALLVEAAGWRETFVLIGGLTLVLALIVVGVVRDRPESAARARPGAGVRGVLAGVRAIVANGASWPPVLAAGGMFATVVTLQGLWGVAWLTQVYGLGRVHAASMMALLGLGVAIGAPLAGWLSDRWQRRRRAFVVFSVAHAGCWLVLVIAAGGQLGIAWLTAFLLVMGAAGGGLALVFACVREVNDPARVGLAIGFCNLPIFLGFGLVQLVSGIVLDARWQGLAVQGARIYPADAYRGLFTVCLAIAVGAAAAAALVSETRCRNIGAPGA
jgi:sugar phosphate permease